ncbi:MAG TPA: zf-HC2 domain-containing protein [Bryobacteraceae bacterium]|jgi:anti-sigma factor RsiW|nr:zf-HC2 domain-containing protein [Bryobacteraceae bacterium]
MNCTEVLELAPLYLSGELELARGEQFCEHLRVCPSCAHKMEEQKTFDSLFRESVLADSVDSTSLERRVWHAIAGESRRRWLALAGVAATLFLGALAIRTAMVPQTTPIFAAAARDHHIEIVDGQARKWLTDRNQIGALAGGQGVSLSMLDAIAPTGYHLQRSRLCFLNGKIFLHLVYVNGSGNLSVFLRRGDGLQKIRMEDQGAEHVAGFQGHQLMALVVTEQPGDAAERFARSAAAIL